MPDLRRLEDIKVKFDKTVYEIRPIFREPTERNPEYRTLLNDSIIELYMSKFMPAVEFSKESRLHIEVFNTFFFKFVQLRLESHAQKRWKNSELDDLHKFFRNFDKASVTCKKKLLVMPIHMEKPHHWYLALIQNPSAAIESIENLEDREDEDDEGPVCRVLIMDSLFGTKKLKERLEADYLKTFQTIRLYLQVVASATGAMLIKNRVRMVVCENLPKQKNNVDCGIYMMAFANYFTCYDTQWMNQSTENLKKLELDPATVEYLNTDEPRHFLERILEKYKTDEK